MGLPVQVADFFANSLYAVVHPLCAVRTGPYRVYRAHTKVRTARWRVYNFFCDSCSTNLHTMRLPTPKLYLYGTVQGVHTLRTLHRQAVHYSEFCAFRDKETHSFVGYADNRGERIPSLYRKLVTTQADTRLICYDKVSSLMVKLGKLIIMAGRFARQVLFLGPEPYRRR